MSYQIRIDSEKSGDTPDIRFRILIGLKGLPEHRTQNSENRRFSISH